MKILPIKKDKESIRYHLIPLQWLLPEKSLHFFYSPRHHCLPPYCELRDRKCLNLETRLKEIVKSYKVHVDSVFLLLLRNLVQASHISKICANCHLAAGLAVIPVRAKLCIKNYFKNWFLPLTLHNTYLLPALSLKFLVRSQAKEKKYFGKTRLINSPYAL